MIRNVLILLLSAFVSLNESTRIYDELANPCTPNSPGLGDVIPQDYFAGQSESQPDMAYILQDVIIAMKEAKTSVNRVNKALRRSGESSRFQRYFRGSEGDSDPEVSTVFKSFKENIKIDYNQTAKMWLNLKKSQSIVNVRHSKLTKSLKRCKDRLVVVLCKLQSVFPDEDMPMVSDDDIGNRMTLVQFRKYFGDTIRLYKHYKVHFTRRNELRN